jgi:hypothetical protein
MAQYITPMQTNDDTGLSFRINQLIDSKGATHQFIHMFEPMTEQLLFSYEI